MIAGQAYGASSPVKTHSPMFYVHWHLNAGARAQLPAEYPERAAYVAQGMVEVDGRPACCVIPADRQVSMKRVAAAFGGKAAAMMPPPKAERLTGYHVGGISPFGQKKTVPTAIEAAACSAPRVWINAGARGVLLGIAPADALRACGGKAAVLSA